MTKRMLIDATQVEETRVAVAEDGYLVDFDYESAFRKPLKGNIFLAKVTRVEPSLQAAFVNFGGNRHGFLPFSEIHPDYFRIPIADREALLAEQEDAIREAEEREAREAAEDAAREEAEKNGKSGKPDEELDIAEADDDQDEESGEETDDDQNESENNDADDADDANNNSDNNEDKNGGRQRNRRGRRRGKGGRKSHKSRRSEKYDDEDHETRFRFNLRRRYKIQEVIKRGQIMLVQVNKEERGNKGAAVGSYLSLPGRYCVLMPNSPRAGGISRKIANYKDRNRMREIIRELEVPKGMSVILRTAGVSRTKAEIKRDLDYLIRLWNEIREGTLKASAPSLIYEEASLIKRAVRDLYTRDVDEIQVAGEEAYKTAKNFMKMMIPSHAKRVKQYKEDDPLFHHYGIEHKIAEIGETQVELPSGGYLVINPTEALVSIDVNSGKATKERHIEETALRTNLEAAAEVARQLRLRDLGGLVVVDFIDMENRRNNGKVERKMRDALSHDRARIQMGRISNFGLMELSRQRMNPSLTESQYEVCDHCNGTGRIRTADATSVMVLRAIEQEGLKKRAAEVIVHVPGPVAVYILNYKRHTLADLEERYGMRILMRVEDSVGAAGFRVEVSKPLSKSERRQKDDQDDGGDDGKDKGGRRRSRRGGRKRSQKTEGETADQDGNSDQSDSDDNSKTIENSEDKSGDDKPKRRRTRSKSSTESKNKTDEKAVEDEKSSAQKTSKDDSKSKSKSKSDAKKTTKKKTVKASNDDQDKGTEEPVAKSYEVVNEAPNTKKKGWWNKLTN